MLAFLIVFLICDTLRHIPCGYEYVPVRGVKVVEVELEDIEKRYTYLTTNLDYQRGELVAVPFGPANMVRIANVVDNRVVAIDELPVPLQRMKAVIGRVNVEDSEDDILVQ